MEQVGLLRHDADLRAEPAAVEAAQVVPVEPDLAARRVVQAQKQRDQGALARARGTHDRHALPGLHREIDVRQRLDAVLVRERNVLEPERPAQRRARAARRRLLLSHVEHLEHALEVRIGADEIHVHGGERCRRGIEPPQLGGERHQCPERETVPHHQQAAEPEDERRGDRLEEADQQPEPAAHHRLAQREVRDFAGLVSEPRRLQALRAEDAGEQDAGRRERLVEDPHELGRTRLGGPPHALALAADRARRDHEQRQERERHEREPPVEVDEHRCRRREHHDAVEHVDQRGRDHRPHALHVADHGRDRLAGPGVHEVGVGEALEVLEHLHPQVPHQRLAGRGGEVLLKHAHEARQHRAYDHPGAEQDQQPQVGGWDRLVDGTLDEERRQQVQQRRDQDRQHDERDARAVGRERREDAAQRRPLDLGQVLRVDVRLPGRIH